MVYLSDGATAVVMAWLVIRGSEPGALLCPLLRGGHTIIRHMTDQAVMYQGDQDLVVSV